MSPEPADISSHHFRDASHGSAEADSLAAELSLIREVFRRLQARARQIEAIQHERRGAGTGAAPAVRSAWVTLTRRPESRSQATTEAEEPSTSRHVAIGMVLPHSARYKVTDACPDSQIDSDRLFDREVYPRRRRSSYNARPGASNSLMSENASEIRARRARDQISSLAANPPRSSDDWPPDRRDLGTSSHGRASPVGEPLFTPADWSLPSFRGSTATREQDSASTARPQNERSRPTPLEPQVRDPFDSWSPPDLWFSPDDGPQHNSFRRPRGTPRRTLNELLAHPNEFHNRPEIYDRSDPLTLLPDPAHQPRDTQGWFIPAPAPAAQPHVRPPSTVNARRDYTMRYDTYDAASDAESAVWRRFHPREPAASNARRANADRDTDSFSTDGLEANSRRRLSRVLALRSMRGDPVPEREMPPSRSPTRTAAPASRVFDHDPLPDNDNLHYDAREELRASMAMPSLFDSPSRPASRAAPSTTATLRRPPTARPTATRGTAARSSTSSRFNLDSFHQGPFRATIQRSLALQNQQRYGAQSSRESDAPSLPPLRFQRSRDEHLVSATH